MSKFQDFQEPLQKFQDFTDLESKFSNSRTFPVYVIINKNHNKYLPVAFGPDTSS